MWKGRGWRLRCGGLRATVRHLLFSGRNPWRVGAEEAGAEAREEGSEVVRIAAFWTV